MRWFNCSYCMCSQNWHDQKIMNWKVLLWLLWNDCLYQTWRRWRNVEYYMMFNTSEWVKSTILLDRGADPNIKNHDGESSILLALCDCDWDYIEMLLDHEHILIDYVYILIPIFPVKLAHKWNWKRKRNWLEIVNLMKRDCVASGEERIGSSERQKGSALLSVLNIYEMTRSICEYL